MEEHVEDCDGELLLLEEISPLNTWGYALT